MEDVPLKKKKGFDMALAKDSMIESILPILRKASKAIMDIYSDEERFNVQMKEDNSPLTEADRLSNDIIVEGLTALYPDIPIISEESKQIDYKQRADYHNCFLVDPLDGTKEFIKRNGEFTINIAFIEKHSPAGGYVFVPATGVAYFAERYHGAYKIDENDQTTEIKSGPFYLMDAGIKVVASRSHSDDATMRIISSLNQPELVSSGSSLKFIMIAEGIAHFYPRLAPTMEWDTAAAQCILEEAGGSVLKAEDLRPLEYNKADLLNPHFIAMGALLDPEMLNNIFSPSFK